MRFLNLKKMLSDIHGQTPIRFVGYEEVRAHKGVDAAHIYGGIVATIQTWCEENGGIPYKGVPVGTIKKFATGNGAASKASMMAAVEDRWGVEHLIDDNEADAIAGLICLLEEGVC